MKKNKQTNNNGQWGCGAFQKKKKLWSSITAFTSKLSIWGILWKIDTREARERRREGGARGRERTPSRAAHFARPNRKACSQATLSSILIGTLSSNDADSNENIKKTIGFISKTTPCTCTTLFCTFLCPFSHDYDVNMTYFAFLWRT